MSDVDGDGSDVSSLEHCGHERVTGLGLNVNNSTQLHNDGLVTVTY